MSGVVISKSEFFAIVGTNIVGIIIIIDITGIKDLRRLLKDIKKYLEKIKSY